MNIESMRVRSYRSIAADEHVPEEEAERYRTLKSYEKLGAAECSEGGALEQLGISRRTRTGAKPTRPHRVRQRAYKPRDVKAVMDVRRKYPFMGKARIHAMLARKGGHLSVWTVAGSSNAPWRPARSAPRRSARDASSPNGGATSRRRRFAALAMWWKYGSKARRPGELVQIDHMTYTDGGRTLKEFANQRFAGRPSGLQVHGDAGLLARHRRQNAAG